jgi:hypothetical protein
MSLWYESLGLCLYDCGENLEERAKCILAHLSMPVPRSWWEHALKTGSVQSTHASLLHDLQMELSKLADLREQLSSGLLVALAFMDDRAPGVPSDRFGDVNSQHTLNDYLTKAKEILAERPELTQLAILINKATGTTINK